MVPASIGLFLNLYADRLVIQHERSLADVGLYGVGYRLGTVVILVLTAFQAAALPLILARKDDPSTPGDLARMFRIFAAWRWRRSSRSPSWPRPALHFSRPPYQHSAAVVPFLLISVLFATCIASRREWPSKEAAASGRR